MWLILSFILFIIIGIFVIAIWLGSDKPPTINLQGAHVIITGGSSGIGLEVAKLVASQGGHVTLMARDKLKLQQAQEQVESVKKNKVQKVVSI